MNLHSVAFDDTLFEYRLDCVACGDAYLWVADPRQVPLDSDHPWSSPSGQASPVQIRSDRICLCLSKDNFAGSKIGRVPRAHRVRARDGADQKSPKQKTPRSGRLPPALLAGIGGGYGDRKTLTCHGLKYRVRMKALG